MNSAFTTDQLNRAREMATANGKALTDFCRTNGLDYYTTAHLLRGYSKGIRGEAYRAAVALGLRKGSSPKKRSAPTANQPAQQAATA